MKLPGFSASPDRSASKATCLNQQEGKDLEVLAKGERAMRVRQALSVLLLVAITLVWSGMCFSADAPRMPKEELRELLGNAEVVVIDVRTVGEWKESAERIAGAVREEPGTEADWGSSYPKEKTLVLYCS
jgi:hypothetical protein